MKASKKKTQKRPRYTAIVGAHIVYGTALVSLNVGAREKGNRYQCAINVASSKGLVYELSLTREQISKFRKAVKV